MDSEAGGKKIRWIYGGFVAMACVLAGAMHQLHLRSQDIARAYQQQAELHELGNQLLRASDYLTAEVRKFAQFGDSQHTDNFWREVRDSRNRDQVVQRLIELAVPENELDLVQMAKANSDALILIETQAMDLTRAGKFDDARKLLFLPHYDAAKAQIIGPIKEFQRRAQERTQQELAHAERAEWIAFVALTGAVVLMFAMAVALASERRSLKAKLYFSDRMASLGTLAAGVAHELNNPLMYIATNLRFVSKKLDEHKRSSAIHSLAGGAATVPASELHDIMVALREASEGAERVKIIIRSLKSFTDPNAEGVADIDLHRPLESALDMCAQEISARAQLTKEFGSIPLVRGAEARLLQVFRNLLMNAAQAIAEGKKAENGIRVKTYSDSGNAVVEISDTGSGIPKNIRGQIFDPFFTTKPIGVGTGLGLAICHSLVSSMGGDIEVETEEGKGSTFRVIIPGIPPEGVDAIASFPDRHSSSKVAGPTEPESRRVLAIDDEPMVLAALRRALCPPHEVITTTDGKEAVDRLARGERFDVILCDMMMPNTTGMDVYKAVGKLAPEQLGRFVFLTGGTFTPRVREFMKGLSTPLLEKPATAERLNNLITSYKPNDYNGERSS
jgi:signal transduction histidine kinase/CheY-like chemotaxis protein